jgi:hypothetical protein
MYVCVRFSHVAGELVGLRTPIGLFTPRANRVDIGAASMEDRIARPEVLNELEARQDEVLRRLDELDQQVEKALAEWLPEKRGAGG